jgi:hypothetical protein
LRTSRFGDLARPIADETGGHLSAQQNRVNGVDQMINEFEEFVIHLAHRPIQFTVRPGHEAIGCDLHLQFQCSHRSPLKFSDRFHFRTDRDLDRRRNVNRCQINGRARMRDLMTTRL